MENVVIANSYEDVFGQNVNAMANNMFYANCLNACNTAIEWLVSRQVA